MAEIYSVSLMFADFIGHLRGVTFQPGERGKSWAFRFYLFWLIFPPMSLLFLERPFGLVVVYGALGAFFMPFLALTLIWLLNSSRTPREWRNGILSNVVLFVSAAIFITLCVNELAKLIAG